MSLSQRSTYGLALLARAAFRNLEPARAVRLGGRIGAAYARAGGPRTAVARRNLEIAFPDWSDGERLRVLRASFENLGRSAAEVGLLSGPQRDTLLAGFRFEGRDELEAARRASPSGAVIFLSAHFGSWESMAVAVAQAGIPLSVVHHAFDNPAIGAMVTDWRQQGGLETLQLGSAGLGAVRALRRGRCVAMLIDQDASRAEGAFAPFFSLDASTRIGPARLAMRLGVPVVPCFDFRDADGLRHTVRFFAPVVIERDEQDEGALLRNVTRMNMAVEAVIRGAPEQWSWLHRRWKTRPEGEARAPYPRRRRLRRALRGVLSAATAPGLSSGGDATP